MQPVTFVPAPGPSGFGGNSHGARWIRTTMGADPLWISPFSLYRTEPTSGIHIAVVTNPNPPCFKVPGRGAVVSLLTKVGEAAKLLFHQE